MFAVPQRNIPSVVAAARVSRPQCPAAEDSRSPAARPRRRSMPVVNSPKYVIHAFFHALYGINVENRQRRGRRREGEKIAAEENGGDTREGQAMPSELARLSDKDAAIRVASAHDSHAVEKTNPERGIPPKRAAARRDAEEEAVEWQASMAARESSA